MDTFAEQANALSTAVSVGSENSKVPLPFEVKESYELIDFFHQAPEMILTDIRSQVRTLKQLIYFLTDLGKTIQDLKNINLENFDPHVGDTACQFRAYLIVKVQKNFPTKTYFHIEHTITFLKDHLEEKLEEIKNKQRVDKVSLKKFLAFLPEFSIQNELFFLYISRFLTVYNVKNEEDLILHSDLPFLMQVLQESQSQIVKLISYYQQTTARLTCHLMMQLAKDLSFEKNKLLALKNLILVDGKNRPTFSCYYGTQLLLQHGLQNNLPLLLSIAVQDPSTQKPYVFNLFCMPQEDQLDFKVIPSSQINSQEALYIIRLSSLIHGESPDEIEKNFCRILKTVGIKNTILMYMARHPQHPGIHLSEYRYHSLVKNLPPHHALQEWHTQFLKHQELAAKMGCTFATPHFFFAKHCFVNTLKTLDQNTLSPITIQQPSIIKNLSLCISFLNSETQECFKIPELTHWIDRVQEQKLLILLGCGIEQSLWGHLEFEAIYKFQNHVNIQKQQWISKNKYYLETLPTQHKLIDCVQLFSHPNFNDFHTAIKNFINSRAEHKLAFNTSAILLQEQWREICQNHLLSEIPLKIIRNHLINITASYLLISEIQKSALFLSAYNELPLFRLLLKSRSAIISEDITSMTHWAHVA